ncbi:hypothetical protein HJC99_04910 [Candidatus Saccharibacteria bacterium]|nr:hypothetical protein [Candidatus Saccharibacteria bacterium]
MTVLIILVILLPFGIGALVGAPYVPILRRDSAALLKLAELTSGQTIVDLGSGDGRFLRAAAKAGYRGIGYEINPVLVVISKIVTWRYRKLVTIHLADFWGITLPPAAVIYVFLIDRLMPKLDAKLAQEIQQSTPVISYIFAIPGRQAEITTRNAFRYRYGA